MHKYFFYSKILFIFIAYYKTLKTKNMKKKKEMKIDECRNVFGFLNIKKMNRCINVLEPLYSEKNKLINVLAFCNDKNVEFDEEQLFLIDIKGKKHLLISVYTADQLKEL